MKTKITLRPCRSLKLAVAALGVLLLTRHVRADGLSFIMIDDALSNDLVQVTWGGIFTTFTVSPNCTPSGTASSGSANCPSEALPIVLTADGPGPIAASPHTLNVNIWEDAAQTILSDTLSATATLNPDATIHGVLTFQSDVDGGPALTPLTGGSDVHLLNVFEIGGTLAGEIGTGSGNPINLTVNVDNADVPEPASLWLLGSGLLVLARNRWRTRV